MKTDNVVKSLKKYGLRVEPYKRPPIGDDVFAMTIAPRHREGVVLMNHGNARIRVHGSKKLRQATISVHEGGRKVTRQCKAFFSTSIPLTKPSPDTMERLLKREFRVVMPSNSEWTVTDVKSEVVINRPGYKKWRITGNVTAEVKEPTTNHFLIGMDETRHFISPISRHAKSVRGAHRLLRTKGVPFGALRQGEWFFVPCDPETSRRLDTIATKQSGRIQIRQLDWTTHVAKSAIEAYADDAGLEAGWIYARGYVTDRRTGHHRSLFLEKWHKVVKNKEAEIKVASFQEEIARRRQRTWD